ncbi:TetR/AcrR family transcriptional regulator [Agromyces sp. SYSU K20354]|uniref:TetR/AcrR family transcriptional regulator n=1 Tax=Agromyces cavernae TaxID=2898659 RepID=UPI001E2F0754|nr:TetR family transcriptional regulator [Agromyces cavernae]MCD2443537.1 TetR/AcrR family transcriptional regulator [Agromyces cavernae]
MDRTAPAQAAPAQAAPAQSLTARRKAATQLEIARAAAVLFTEHGADQVTAEAIAASAGVSLRTFYRYFRTKEDAVGPLLAGGADAWQQALAATTGDPIAAIPAVIEAQLTPRDDLAREGLRWTRGLLRAAVDDPALLTVWHRVNHDSESRLQRIIAGLAGDAADDFEVRLAATAATDAVRIGLEAWAAGAGPDTGPGSPADLATRAFAQLSRGIALVPEPTGG